MNIQCFLDQHIYVNVNTYTVFFRAVPVIGDRRMWNWKRKCHVTDLDYKAEKATPIVSIANNKLVDLVNRRKEIAVWKLKVDNDIRM